MRGRGDTGIVKQTSLNALWIPAFAGMTRLNRRDDEAERFMDSSLRRNDGTERFMDSGLRRNDGAERFVDSGLRRNDEVDSPEWRD